MVEVGEVLDREAASVEKYEPVSQPPSMPATTAEEKGKNRNPLDQYRGRDKNQNAKTNAIAGRRAGAKAFWTAV